MNFIRKHFRKLSIAAMVVVAAVTIASLFEIRKNTRFDYDFETFFPIDDPELEAYLDFRNKFEYDNEFVLLAIENSSGIFSRRFLENVQALTDSLRRIPDITQVISPTDLTYLTTAGKFPYMHIEEPERYKEDSAFIYRNEELVGSFFPPDARSLSIFIRTTNGISKEKSDLLLARMNHEISRHQFEKIHLASKLNAQKVYLDQLRKEFVLFFISSFFLIVLFLYASFRSFWGVWVPVLVVLLAIIWTLALMTRAGKTLDIMTVLLPTMLFIVGMSDVVHILTKYLEEMRRGVLNRFDALLKTIREVGFATFITLLTTGLGFLTLLNSRIIPIRDFGLYTSIGVFIAFILAFTIMPVVLSLIRLPDMRTEKISSQFWSRRLLFLLSWIFRHGKKIGVVLICVVLISAIGISKINLNNYLIEGLTTKDELRHDFIFFEKNYSGVRPFEMSITPVDPKGSVIGVNELRALDQLEQYLKTSYGVGFMISPITLVKGIHKAQYDGNPDYFTLPPDSAGVAELAAEVSKNRKRKEVKLYLSQDEKTGRMSGKMHDIGSKKIRELDKKLDSFLMTDPALKAIRAHRTGAAVILDRNNEYLVENMLQGLLLSILVVAIVISIIHRSWKMAIIAVIPNFLPII
ncbi:MAG TPA: MMPL family transporter, partial [Bacteroidia bacterium]|nr:MMPL family transporter [Bacteroidia bacterium]